MSVTAKPAKPEHCAMCARDKPLTFHHLIPRTNHSNKWFKKRFDKLDMTHRGVWLCRACHKHLHRTFSEKELGREYNTLEAILSEPQIQKFVGWVRKQR